MDFSTVLIKDSRINDISHEEMFGVQSGASQSTFQQFTAVSSSAQSMTFNIQVPSESIVIDRNVRIKSTINLQIQIPSTNPNFDFGGGNQNVPAGYIMFNYGESDSFSNFPLNSLFTTVQATINNTTVSTNLQDILPIILRQNSAKSLSDYNSTTPCLPDTIYGFYGDAWRSSNAPFNSCYQGQYNEDYTPRGAFALTNFNIDRFVNGVWNANNTNVCQLGNGTESWLVSIQVEVTEPLLGLSPFTSGKCEFNNQGLMGINNMAFVFNIDSSCKRVWSSSGCEIVNGNVVPYYSTITLGFPNRVGNPAGGAPVWTTGNNNSPFLNPQLLFNFLTLQASDHKETKNICPYFTYPRFITNYNTSSAIAPGASTDIVSNNIQLSTIPDFIYIACRVPMASQNMTIANSFLTINKISINFNNSSGILSSASSQDLWRLSKKNGSQQTWQEFCGKINKRYGSSGIQYVVGNIHIPVGSGITAPIDLEIYNTTQANPNINPPTAGASYLATYAQDGSDVNQNATQGVASIGSILVIAPAYDLNLPDVLSASSMGQFNFQFNINVTNNLPYSITPETIVVTANSGLFVTQQGVSSSYVGLLTKQQVLDAKEKKPESDLTDVQYERLVGGSMDNRGVSHLKKIFHAVNPASKYNKEVKTEESGMELDGGAMSAGVMSAGKVHKVKKNKSKLHKYV